jgi:glutamate-ammonia-ligase adenylyltransferase
MQENLQIAQLYSQFIRNKLLANPEWEHWVDQASDVVINESFLRGFFSQELSKDFLHSPEPQFLSNLRKIRQQLMLVIAVRDLSGLAAIEEVMQAMTCLAEESLHYACEYYSYKLSAIYGRPQYADQSAMPLWVVGMGKLGGGELNVSSDIDLIFIYDEDGHTTGENKSISYHEWFHQLGKKVIKALSEITADGFVFRVDMRLRPNGDSGPLVCSLKMLEEYFLVQGREWERYAWIKARLVYPLSDADENGMPKSLSAVVRPFVYRKYLDYGIIDSIRSLHHQIRHEANLRATQFPDRAADIKLGVGGIREIEFVAQMYQMIYGGQQKSLRIRSTIQTLLEIRKLRLMPNEDVDFLWHAYRFYRTVEHRLQWWNDAQIHYLPVASKERTRIAHSLGLANEAELQKQLSYYQERVSVLFSSAFATNQDEKEQTNFSDVCIGFFQFYPRFQKWYEQFIQSSRYRLANESTKQNLNIIFLRLSEYETKVSEKVLMKFVDLIEVIMRRAAYLSLLREYPKVLQRVFILFSESEWGANYLIQHPHLLDQLIQNEGELSPEKNGKQYWDDWHQLLIHQLDVALREDDDQELAWNVLRDMHHAEIFQTLLADLGIGREKNLSVEQVSDRLSQMADIVIAETLDRIWHMISLKNSLPDKLSNLGFGVIAYGKLGGKELGYGSDLDLVFVYDDLHPNFKEEYVEYFVILVRRLILWFTTVTSSGILFDIDTRLRPNGMAGLMVSSLSSFEAYQKRQGTNTAWVWEHQALTRARFCAGCESAQRRFNSIRQDVLCLPRSQKLLLEEIQNMRQKIHDGHPNPSPDFDLKHDPGGMVDIEFMTQFIVLRFSSEYLDLVQNLGNIALLRIAAKHQIIDETLAEEVAKAYRDFRKLQHQLRLDGNSVARISTESMTPRISAAREKVIQLWQQLMR